MATMIVTYLMGAAFAATTLGMVVTAVLSYAITQALYKAFAPEPPNTKDQGVKTRVSPDTANKLPIVYGRQRVRGTIVMADMSADAQRMAFIIALGSGSINDVLEVKWSDKVLTFNGDVTTGLRSVTNAINPDLTQQEIDDLDGENEFLNDGRCKIRVYKSGGRCSHMESFSAVWGADGSNRSMPDTPYFYCEIKYSREDRVTGIGDISFEVEGKKVGSINSDFTIGVDTYSDNPAECFLDYMTDVKSGMGVSLSSIDLESLFDLKEFCNDTKSYTDKDGNPATAKRYTCNGTVNTNQDTDANISGLLSNCQSSFSYTLGKFGVIINRVKVSTHSFSEENIFGSITITDSGFDNIINDLTVKYTSLNKNYQEDQVLLASPESIKNSNEPLLEKTLTYSYINNNIEAERVGTVLINQMRQNLLIEFTTDVGALTVQSGDVIKISHATPGWADKKFRVMDMEETSVDDKQSIGLKIQALEYADAVYDDLLINETDVAPNTHLLDPNTNIVVSSLIATEDTDVGESNINLNWASSPASVVSSHEVRYKLSGVNQAYSYRVVGSGLQTDISSLVPNANYDVGVRGVSTLGKTGNWTTVAVSTGPARSIGLTQRGEWPTTGTVIVYPGDIYVHAVDMWFFNGTAEASIDASTVNPSNDSVNSWTQVVIPEGINGLTSYVWLRVVNGSLQWLTTNSTANPDGTAVPAWTRSDEVGVDIRGEDGNTWHSGSGVPEVGLGVDGDHYLRTDDESTYIKASGSWSVNITTLSGSNGVDADVLNFIFKDSSTLPTTPADSAGVPTGWSDSSPATVTNTLYSVLGTQTNGVGNFTWGNVQQISGSDGLPGDPGTSVFVATVYRRAANQPVKPTGGSYNFSTNSLAVPTDWNENIIDGTDPIWGSSASFSVVGNTATDSSTTWSNAGRLAQDGSNGSSAGVLIVYADDASGTNKTTTLGSQEFVLYHEYTGAAPAVSSVTGTWVRFVGEDGVGTPGASVWPIYAVDAAGNSQSFSPSLALVYVTFYESSGIPGLPVAGQTFLKYIGSDGVGTPGVRGPGRFSKSIGVTTAPNVGTTTFNTHALGAITDAITGAAPVAGDIVVITYTETAGSVVTKSAIHDGTGVAANDWGTFALEIDGSLLVNGTVAGSAISSTGSITSGSGNNVAVMDGSDANYRFYAGNATASSAPFRVKKDGSVVISSSVDINTSRLVIDNDQIAVYEGNQLKVLIGRLN